MERSAGQEDPIATVGIAICTFRRPDALRTLLASVAAQELGPHRPHVVVAVVDNCPDGDGAAAARSVEHDLPFPMRIAVELEPGISAARNRTIELLVDDCDTVVFVDDDEVVTPGWLDHLLRTATATGAGMIGGPVLPEYCDDAPAWMRSGKYHTTGRHPDGTEVETTGSGNLLVRRRVLQDLGSPWFDLRFGFTDGGDALFVARARRLGHRLVWSDHAVATEAVPPERARVGWLVRRSFSGGSGYARAQRIAHPGRSTDLRLVVKAVARLGLAIASVPFSVWSAGGRTDVLRSAATAIGQLAGLSSKGYQQYRRPDVDTRTPVGHRT